MNRLLLVAGLVAASLWMMPRGEIASARSAPNLGISSLRMFSATTGWGWGISRVTRTTNGAKTLIDATPPGATPIITLYAISPTRAWVVWGNGLPGAAWWLERTSNGGKTWTRSLLRQAARGHFGGIDFVDSRHGWSTFFQATSNNRATQITLLRTTDGGAHWSSIYTTVQRVPVQLHVQKADCTWMDVVFSSPTVGVAGLGCSDTRTPRMDVTTNSGRSWHRISLPAVSHPAGTAVSSLAYAPQIFGVKRWVTYAGACIGSSRSCYVYATLYRTDDGGRTWKAGRTYLRVGGGVASMADERHAWLPYACPGVCSSKVSYLQRTADDGDHWTALRLPAALGESLHDTTTFDFVSVRDGFAINGSGIQNITSIYRTSDGGKTWVKLHSRIANR